MKKILLTISVSLLAGNICFADTCGRRARMFAKHIVEFTDETTNGLNLDKQIRKEKNTYFYRVHEDYNASDYVLKVVVKASWETPNILRACVPVSFEWQQDPL